METNAPYDRPPAHLMKKAGFPHDYNPREIIHAHGEYGQAWIVDGRFVGEQSPCLTCGYHTYCQSANERCSDNSFDAWTPKPAPGERLMDRARLNEAKRPVQICCSGGELFALMGDGKIRVKSPTSPWIDIAEQPGDTV